MTSTVKILAFTDTHGDVEAAERILAAARAVKPDLVVSAGDVTLFGKEFAPFFEKLGALEQKVYFVPGNHETGETAEDLVSRYPYLENVAYRPLRVGKIWVGGLGADGIVSGGYENEDIFLTMSDCWKDHVNQDRPAVFLTHYAPSRTGVDGIPLSPSGGRVLQLPAGDEGGAAWFGSSWSFENPTWRFAATIISVSARRRDWVPSGSSTPVPAG